MDYNENWGIAFPRVSEFFSQQSDVLAENACVFRYKDARIELEELPEKRMGSLRLARTRVTISGGTDADEIHRRFYLRFLSAGG